MPTTTTELTRADKIARYIELDAIETVVRGGWSGSADEFFRAFNFQDEGLEMGGDLLTELWPDDAATESEEFRLAIVRSELLASKLFDHLVEIGPAEARYYRNLAERHLVELEEKDKRPHA